MNEKFFDQKKEKQDRMIAAVLKVFALHGYEAAGTDEIVREAGISKGLLFHYFESKLGAYVFAYDYVVRFLELELGSAVSSAQRDPFELAKQAEGAAAMVMRSYPYAQLFLYRARAEESAEALEAVRSQREQAAAMQERIRAQADFSGYRPEVPKERIWRMMDYCIRGVLEEALLQEGRTKSFTPEDFRAEVCACLDLLALSVRRVSGVPAL